MISSSNLWRYVKALTLITNVRVQLQNYPSADEFSQQLLAIGNGKLPIDNLTEFWTLSSTFCSITQSKEELIQSVFPCIAQQHKNDDWLSEHVILAVKNKDANDLNTAIQNGIAGQLVASQWTLLCMKMTWWIILPNFWINLICKDCHHTIYN